MQNTLFGPEPDSDSEVNPSYAWHPHHFDGGRRPMDQVCQSRPVQLSLLK